MILNNTDYKTISQNLEIGNNTFIFDKEGETLTFDYFYEEDGYEEYGWYIVTHREVTIYDITCVNEDDEEVSVNFDEGILQKMVA